MTKNCSIAKMDAPHSVSVRFGVVRNMRLICCLLLLLTFNFLSQADAYKLLGYKWDTPAATFYVDIPGNNGLWNTSFETAMQSWGVDTIFQYNIVRGTYKDPCGPLDPFNGRNGVGFSSTNCGDAWGNTTLAVTQSHTTWNSFFQSDIVFNSNHSWSVYSTPWSSSSYDFQRVAVHELGHALGLGHEDSGVATIMGTYVGNKTIPQQDDINGVAAIYGSVGAAVPAPATIAVPNSDSDGNFTVSWAQSSMTGVTYLLEEATNSLFTSGLRTAYSGPSTSIQIIGRTSGVTYYYRVKATKSGYTDSPWVTGGNGCQVVIPLTVTGITAPTATNSLLIPVTISVSNGVGVTAYLVTTSPTQPTATASGWSSANPFIYTVTADGTYTLYGWAKDGTGNVSSQFTPVTITVDRIAPTATGTNPTTNATGFVVSNAITITFSEAMNASSINSSTFTVKSGTTALSGTVSYNAATRTAIFTPSSSLSGSTTYTITVTTGVKDAAGNAMGNASTWGFTTQSVPSVTTIAGLAGISGSLNGTGSAARFYSPKGVTTDGTNLYVADTSNNTIRKIVIATGVVTTLAGSGSSGYADGTGSAAGFSFPEGITTDGTNLYVSDTYNNAIRRIVIATASVTTLAGSGSSGYADGTGSAARFYYPRGITTDGTNLYVADTSNNTIRKIVIATGVVTTLAGSVSFGSDDGAGLAARFYYPKGITTDGTNLYVADTSNNTIRKIVIADGTTTTLAGSTNGSTDGIGSVARFNWPEGIATDGTNVYVADTWNNTIRKIVATTASVTTLAGSSASGYVDGTSSVARFSHPGGITTDGTDLYVADYYNHTIRKISSIINDTTLPTVTGVTASTPTNSLSIPVTITASDSVGVTAYLTTASSSQPAVIDSGWSTANTFIYNVTADGTYTLYGWAKDGAGNISSQHSPISVTVDRSTPTITAVTPSANTTGFEGNAITVTFSKAMDASTINSSTFIVKLGPTIVAGTVNYNASTKTATFTPSLPLSSGTSYTVTLTAGIKDAAGNPQASISSWSFSTQTVQPHFVTSGSNVGGLITPEGSQAILYNSPAVFTLNPAPGYMLVGVTGSCGGTLNGRTYTTQAVIADCTVGALFAKADLAFDEDSYLAANSDVAAAAKSGYFLNGWQHYSIFGSKEGRALSPADYGSFNENAYLAQNSDVAGAVKAGYFLSGWQHYSIFGKAEGRALLPAGYQNFSEDAYLAANSDVAAAVRSGSFSSGWQHYAGFGKNEGRALSPTNYGTFKEDAYLAANADVAGAVHEGWLDSGWVHYANWGKTEGRPTAPPRYVIYNENAYLAANPDVAALVKSGSLSSGWEHYAKYGKSQGRLLAPADYGLFNENAYLAANTDIAGAVRNGLLSSGWEHYANYGKNEGRFLNPSNYGSFNEGDYLAANPDVHRAVLKGTYSSGWDQYQQSGKSAGRPLN